MDCGNGVQLTAGASGLRKAASLIVISVRAYMAITVLLQVYHTAQQGQLVGSSADQRIVIPNVDPRGTVGEQIKGFVQERLGVPLDLQVGYLTLTS